MLSFSYYRLLWAFYLQPTHRFVYTDELARLPMDQLKDFYETQEWPTASLSTWVTRAVDRKLVEENIRGSGHRPTTLSLTEKGEDELIGHPLFRLELLIRAGYTIPEEVDFDHPFLGELDFRVLHTLNSQPNRKVEKGEHSVPYQLAQLLGESTKSHRQLARRAGILDERGLVEVQPKNRGERYTILQLTEAGVTALHNDPRYWLHVYDSQKEVIDVSAATGVT